MRDFSIEGDKDTIKTQPRYPACCCKQQDPPHSPAPNRFIILRKLREYRLHWKNWSLLLPWKNENKSAMGRRPSNEEQLNFPGSPHISIIRQCVLGELLSTF